MPVSKRACAVASLYAMCISSVFGELHNAKLKGYAYDAARYKSVESAASAATGFVGRACSPDPLSDDDHLAWTRIGNEFNTQWRAALNGTVR